MEIGFNLYDGTTCTGHFVYNKAADLTNGATACLPAGPGYSFKGFVSSTKAFFQKYSSLNSVITLNYPTPTCLGQYPTVDITIFDPCMPSSYTNGTLNGGAMSVLFTPTGATYSIFNTTNCDQKPVSTVNSTYAAMKYTKCTPTEDTHDNYGYNIQTTKYLIH